MLRTLVLLLVIATPLLSQDLLVDSIEREFSGTLIEITDTDIIFQIQGETEPVRYPFWAVKRVTLANGRLAFEDGKTYVAKPTLPVEARPAEPMPTVPKPEEPLPTEVGPEEPLPEEPRPAEIADDEKDKRPPLLSQDLLVDSKGREHSGTLIEITDTHIYFQIPDRTTPISLPLKSVKRVTLADGRIAYEGEPEAAPSPQFDPVTGEPPVFTEADLMTMAQNNAKRDHNPAAWVVGGVLLGCGGMWAGAIGGAIVGNVITHGLTGSLLGFGMGAVVGGVLTAEGLARFPTSVSLPAELAGATPQQHEKYRQLYRAEARTSRRRSIYRALAGVGCAAAAAMFYVISSGPPSF